MSEPDEIILADLSQVHNIPLPGSICIVAFLTTEDFFLDEWLAYHRLIGVTQFILYNQDFSASLVNHLRPFSSYVTLIPWTSVESNSLARRAAMYSDALRRLDNRFDWISCVDTNEFIVLRKDPNLQQFLHRHQSAGQISLNVYLFGHSGYFDLPPHPVISSLVCRRKFPEKLYRSIVRVDAISHISHDRDCELRAEFAHIDPNGRRFDTGRYRGKTEVAHINQYVCPSFRQWMQNAPNDVSGHTKEKPQEQRLDASNDRLREFVSFIARDLNAHIDDFLVKYRKPVIDSMINSAILRAQSGCSRQRSKNYGDSCVLAGDLVVYTAIAGGYDSLKEQYRDGVDFVAFLEQASDSTGWQVHSLDRRGTDPNRDAKIYKILSHVYFPERRFTLWIDGSVRLNVSALSLLDVFLGDFDMVVHKHPLRNCVFAEGAACIQKRLDDPVKIDLQLCRYKKEGLPRNAGLYENTVILRRHNERVRAFNEIWWDEIQRGSRRDQLSVVYAARKVGLRVGYFPGSLRTSHHDYNGLFSVASHSVRRTRR